MPAGSSRGPAITKSFVHQVKPFDAVALLDEPLLGILGVNQQDVTIAVHGVADRLTGSHGNDLDDDAGRIREHGKNVVEQPGILGRGGGLDDDGPVIGRGHAGCEDEAENRREEKPVQHR